ncbi:g7053 [Coccomyxa elongata]
MNIRCDTGCSTSGRTSTNNIFTGTERAHGEGWSYQQAHSCFPKLPPRNQRQQKISKSKRQRLRVQAAAEQVKAADGPGGQAQGFPPDKWLFEPVFGLPIVRRQLKYAELLKEIRLGNVKKVAFFDNDDIMEDRKEFQPVEGPCLVIFRDDRVAHSYVPRYDFRIPYAMETHGVVADRVAAPITQNMIQPVKPASAFTRNLLNVLPFLALGLAYAATQYAAHMKGDREDRQRIKDADIRKEKELKAQREADDRALEARKLASMGYSVEEIIEELNRIKLTGWSREYIEKLVAEEQARADLAAGRTEYTYNTEESAQREALKEARRAGEEANDMEKAQDFGRLRTMKVQQAVQKEEEEEMRVRMRQAQRKMKGVKLQYTDSGRVTFDDVAGVPGAKVELMEVVDFFLKPQKFRRSGARIPRGVLLCGPPGTGKTLLARAVAGEAGVAFLSLNASEFVEMFVGVGASRVRDLFAQARALAPAIIFVDEIDAVGRVRGGAQGNDERDQTLNQLLSEMDGFSNTSQVIVMAATNRKDVLDPALIRPGRFDRIIHVGAPDFEGRIEVLKVHLGKRLANGERRQYDLTEEEFHDLSFQFQRFSGAMLANLVNTAVIIAGREGRTVIRHDDLTRALEEERLGPRRQPYSGERQKRLAVQEAATALICTLMPAIEPVSMVTIVPREKYPLGQTVLKVNEQRERTHMFSRRYLEEQLMTTLAGRAGEEIMYGGDEVSTINQRRLVMARRIVSKLVVSGGMTDISEVGPRTISAPMRQGSRSLKQLITRRTSCDTLRAVDVEMDRLLNETYADVKAMLERNRDAYNALIHALTTGDDQTLSGEQVREIVEQHGCKEDLDRRTLERAAFL